MRVVRTRYIPEAAVAVKHKRCEAVAYLFTSKRGNVAALVYKGKQSKPYGNYIFKDEAQRARYIERTFKEIADQYAEIERRRVERAAGGHGLIVGQILSCSWGYDQTNVDFYQVVAIHGKKLVSINMIESKKVGYDPLYMAGKKAPVKDSFIGQPMRKEATDGVIKIESYAYARIWEGVPLEFTTYA